MYWAASCGGCDISVLNLHEAILDFAERFDIVFWPAVMDAKYADVEAMPDGSIDLHPLLRRHPQHRERRAGPAAAAQVGDPGRLRIVRHGGLHSRAWRT